MLSGFEEGPSRADWRALGEAVLPSLAQVASDRSAESFLRERAVSAAASFSTPAARTLLTRALRDRHAMVVRAAILGLADAFGESALGSITPFLTHTDTALREAAIRALASVESSASTRALLGARARESDEVLREQIEAALGLLLAMRWAPGPEHLFFDPRAALGGFPATQVGLEVRNDFVQHAGSAMLNWAGYLRRESP
jgi:HEAT repeat protein